MSFLINPHIFDLGHGELIASASAISGSGSKVWDGAGTLSSSVSNMTGTGYLIDTGQLFSGLSTVNGSGSKVYTGTGALTSGPAAIEIPFVPTDITSIELWLDADDISTLYIDGGVTQVSTNNDVIGRWTDKSGNGYYFGQGTTSKKPLYKTSGIGSKPAIYADGSDDVLVGSTPASNYTFLSDGSARSIFIVFKSDSDSGIIMGNNPSPGLRVDYSTTNQRVWINIDNGDLSHSSGDNSFLTSTAYVFQNDYEYGLAGNDSFIYKNGTLVNSVESTAAPNTGDPTVPLMLFDWDYFPLYPFKGWISEIIAYSEVLSSDDRLRVNNYLKGKWGIT